MISFHQHIHQSQSVRQVSSPCCFCRSITGSIFVCVYHSMLLSWHGIHKGNKINLITGCMVTKRVLQTWIYLVSCCTHRLTHKKRTLHCVRSLLEHHHHHEKMISDFGLFGPKDQKEVCVYVNFEVVLVCFSIKTTIHVSLYFLSQRCCKIIVGMVLELSANGGTCVKIIDLFFAHAERKERFVVFSSEEVI